MRMFWRSSASLPNIWTNVKGGPQARKTGYMIHTAWQQLYLVNSLVHLGGVLAFSSWPINLQDLSSDIVNDDERRADPLQMLFHLCCSQVIHTKSLHHVSLRQTDATEQWPKAEEHTHHLLDLTLMIMGSFLEMSLACM